jgi:hypothetical protein
MKAFALLATLFAGLTPLLPASAADHGPMLPTTTPPITYTINYSGDYFTAPEYIDRFKAAPPDLLHVGKATPILHLWGAVGMYQGENQSTGGPGHTLSWENIELISPQALAERIENIRRTLKRYHEIGIREITPYISYHTLAGDHEKRLGFWKFYDNWPTYAKWAGPRPEHDPFDWLVVDARGRFVGGSCGGYSPDYYAPLHRYRACINHPDWCEWHQRLIRMIAEVGYDGCFVDNCHPDDCYCGYCKAVFREFLRDNRELDWVRRMTAGLDVDKLQLDSPDVPNELVRRVRLLRTADHLKTLRETGRQVKSGFTIFPNGNSVSECMITGGTCDRLMFESTYSPGILAADETPVSEEVAVVVSADVVDPKRFTHRCELADGRTFMELQAEIRLPANARVGESTELAVKLVSVGSSPEDGDFAEGFFIQFQSAQGGPADRVELAPSLVVGGAASRSGEPGRPKQPPLELAGNWTPAQPGVYSVGFGFAYTDESHLKETHARPHLALLDRGQVCRTHVGTLSFAQQMQARTILLGYETRRSGWENVAELAMAEMAAFGGGGGLASGEGVQAKYGAFFKRHAELFAGWRPTAPAAVLFARWGSNPLAHVRPLGRPAIHDRLAGTQRPFVALLDWRLPESPDPLGPFEVIYLEANDYDLSDRQLEALQAYAERGGCLVIADEAVAINGRPAVDALGVSGDRPVSDLGRGRVAIWNWSDPPLPTKPFLEPQGRGRHLRLAAYRKNDRLALHLVNYNVCLLDKSKRVLDVEDVQVQVPLPAGWTSARARCFDPDGDPNSLECRIIDGVARLTLPRVHLYSIVLLEGS